MKRILVTLNFIAAAVCGEPVIFDGPLLGPPHEENDETYTVIKDAVSKGCKLNSMEMCNMGQYAICYLAIGFQNCPQVEIVASKNCKTSYNARCKRQVIR